VKNKSQTSESDFYPAPASRKRPVLDWGVFVPYLVNQITNLMNVPFKRDLKKNRMSYAHWTVLATLAHQGPRSLNELCVETVIDQPSLSRIIDQMVERNLVVRRPREDDARFVSISMTPFGRQRYLQLSAVAISHGNALIEGITESEIEQLRRTLTKILRQLEARRRE
jgi:DNA-binding MarR family transcriptional regulator